MRKTSLLELEQEQSSPSLHPSGYSDQALLGSLDELNKKIDVDSSYGGKVMVKTRFYILFSILVLTIPQISTAALLHINDPSLPASSDGFNITRDTSTGLIGLIGLARHKQFV